MKKQIEENLSKTNITDYLTAFIIDPLTIDSEKTNDNEYIKELIIKKIKIFDNDIKSKNYLTRILYSNMIKKNVGHKFNFLINDILVFSEITSNDPIDFKIYEKLTSDKYTWIDENTNDLWSRCLVIINKK